MSSIALDCIRPNTNSCLHQQVCSTCPITVISLKRKPKCSQEQIYLYGGCCRAVGKISSSKMGFSTHQPASKLNLVDDPRASEILKVAVLKYSKQTCNACALTWTMLCSAVVSDILEDRASALKNYLRQLLSMNR